MKNYNNKGPSPYDWGFTLLVVGAVFIIGVIGVFAELTT
jgi:hypothetical protein